MTREALRQLGNDERRALLKRMLEERAAPARRKLTPAQRQIWIAHQLDAERATYNVPAGVAIDGWLDLGALERAAVAVIASQEAFRTCFVSEEGAPYAISGPPSTFALRVTDLSACPDPASWRALAAEEARRAFDLARAPLFRLVVYRLRPDAHVLVTVCHHLVTDGWSLALFVRDLLAHYDSERDGVTAPRPGPVAPARPAVLPESARIESALAFWGEQLRGVSPPGLPEDWSPARRSSTGAIHVFSVSAVDLAGLLSRAAEERATSFMALLAVFASLLSRHGGGREQLVTTPIVDRSGEASEEVMGLFVNTLLLRVRLDPAGTFRDLLRHARDLCIDAFEHKEAPLEAVMRAVTASTGRSASELLRVMFTLQNVPSDPLVVRGLRFTELPIHTGAASFDLSLDVREVDGGLKAHFEYDTAVFHADTIARLARCFSRLIGAAARAPDVPIAALEILSREDQEELGALGSGGADPEIGDGRLHEPFERCARRSPDRIAFVEGGAQITYRVLEARASRVARALQQVAPRPGVVGILLERGVSFATAMIGVLKAGHAFVPVDTDLPDARVASVITSGLCAVVVDAATRSRIPEGADVALVELDVAVRGRGAPVGARVTGASPAYVMFTSGSTGVPKGAILRHDGARSHAAAQIDALGLSDASALLQSSPASSDMCIWQNIAPLYVGGRVVLATPEQLRDPALLHRVVQCTAVSTFELVPASLQLYLDHLRSLSASAAALPALTHGMVSGEAAPRSLVADWFDVFPRVPLVNAYGPTEASDDVAQAFLNAPLADAERSVPIGRPLAGCAAFVVSDDLRLLPRGATGEICVAGVGLAQGYRGAPRMTAERFVPHPLGRPGERIYRTGDRGRWRVDGQLEYLGRADHQVQIRGHRTELGEVEAALGRDPIVAGCVVVPRERDGATSDLVAFVCLRVGDTGDVARSAAEIRARARALLPSHAVPSSVVVVERFPLTNAGKIDRVALLRLTSPAAAPARVDAPARDHVATCVSRAWVELLGEPNLAADADFFALGGHSLLATRLAWRLRDALGVELPLRTLFEAPTLAGFTERVREIVARSPASDVAPPAVLIPQARGPVVPLSFAQRRLWFVDRLDPGSPAYCIPMALWLEGHLDVPALETALYRVFAHHESLRTVFAEEAGEPRQIIVPPARRALPIVDLGALDEVPRAAALARIVAADAQRGFDLETGPLVRVHLIRVGPARWALAINLHHIVADEWSLDVLVRHIVSRYAAALGDRSRDLAPPRLQYADYAIHEQATATEERIHRHLSYWRTKLAGVSRFELPRDAVAPAHAAIVGTERVVLDVASSEMLRALARREGASVFMTLVAVFVTALHHAGRRNEIVIGTDVAGRDMAGTEELVGFFVNQLVLRFDVAPSSTFLELLRATRTTCLEAFEHQALPFDRLVEDLRPPRAAGATPFFGIKVSMQTPASAEGRLPGLSISPMPPPVLVPKTDMVLYLADEPPGIELKLEYDRSAFLPSTAARLVAAMRDIVGRILAEGEVRIRDLGSAGGTGGARDERMRKNRDRLREITARRAGEKGAIAPEAIPAAESLPALVVPPHPGDDLARFVASRRQDLLRTLDASGAILLRDFSPRGVERFGATARAMLDRLTDDGGEHERASLEDGVYAPVYFPPEQVLLWHNENSFNPRWPTRIMFGCRVAASRGGETTLVDSRALLGAMRPELLRRFERDGVMYVRNYRAGVGRSWRQVFGTDRRDEVEARCREMDLRHAWLGDHLRTWCVRDATVTHPRTGRRSWFAQLQHWHPACLDPELRADLASMCAPDEMPRSCRFGDGTPIDDDVMRELCALYSALEVVVAWQPGDVLVLDNLAVAHGRKPFAGERKLVVAMGDEHGFDEQPASAAR